MTESFERHPGMFGAGIDDLSGRLDRVEVDDAMDDEQARDAAREVLDLGIRLLDAKLMPTGYILLSIPMVRRSTLFLSPK